MTQRRAPGGAPRISAAAQARWNERLAAEGKRDALIRRAIEAGLSGDMEEYARLSAEAATVIIPDYL